MSLGESHQRLGLKTPSLTSSCFWIYARHEVCTVLATRQVPCLPASRWPSLDFDTIDTSGRDSSDTPSTDSNLGSDQLGNEILRLTAMAATLAFEEQTQVEKTSSMLERPDSKIDLSTVLLSLARWYKYASHTLARLESLPEIWNEPSDIEHR